MRMQAVELTAQQRTALIYLPLLWPRRQRSAWQKVQLSHRACRCSSAPWTRGVLERCHWSRGSKRKSAALQQKCREVMLHCSQQETRRPALFSVF